MLKKIKYAGFKALCWILAVLSLPFLVFMLLMVETYFVTKASWFALTDDAGFCDRLGEYNRNMLDHLFSSP